MIQKRLENIVKKTIAEHNLLTRDDKILVAVSGGADSVALLCVLVKLGYYVEALHCNFHLRGKESDRDEEFVQQLCETQKINLYRKHFDTHSYCKQNKVSIEMGARALRYEWFDAMLKEREANCICVAHHQQDQAETLLLNLIRGTGLRGLAGMHYKNERIVRPLLDCSRQDIEQYLHELNQDWVTDSTNAERDAFRNRIRLDVLPLLTKMNPQAIKNIAKTANIIQESLPIYMRGLTQQKEVSTSKTISFQKPDTKTELHEMLLGYGYNATQIENIWRSHTGAIFESTHYRIVNDRDIFLLEEKQVESKKKIHLTPKIETKVLLREDLKSLDSNKAYFDQELIPLPLTVRPVKKGDCIIPFGMKNRKLVSDLLTDMKVNRFEKERQHVICDAKNNILWVIGRRTSELYRITDKTKKVLVVSSVL